MTRAAAKPAKPKTARKPDRVGSAAVPAEALTGEFPALGLAVQPPFPPMEARSS